MATVNAFGIDASADYQLKNSFVKKISLSYSYLILDKEAVTFDSKYALDYLRHEAVLSLNHTVVSKLMAQWKLSYNDRAGNYTDFATKQKLNYSPFAMLDIRMMWVDKHFDIFADANNVLNVKYADYGGLVQPGANFNVGVRVKL